MKKATGLLCLSACLFALSGCKDASAQISDSNEALVTINGTSITRGKIFTMMKKSDSTGSAALALVKEKIYELEDIEVTDEMKEEAASTLNDMQESLEYDDEEFEEYLISMGFDDADDYMEQVSYPTLKEQALVEKYVQEKKTSILSTYTPIKAQIMVISDEDSAEEALEAIQNGDDFEEVAEEYENSNSDKGAETIYYSGSSIPTDVFTQMVDADNGIIDEVIEDTTNSVYYIVNIVDNDSSNFEDEALEEIASDASSSSSELNTTIWSYYLTLHEFTIYDIDVYNGIQSSYESYIVQD